MLVTVAQLALTGIPRARAQPDAGPASDAGAPPDGAGASAPERARAAYQAGMVRYAARDFAAAARLFAEAQAVDPRPETLFAQAQSTRLAGDCPAAVGLFQAFLAGNPPPRQVEATRLALARCAPQAAAVAPQPTPAAQPRPRPPESPRALPAPPLLPPPALVSTSKDPAGRWYRDRAGGALLLGAVALAGAATVLFISAHGADADARRAPLLDGYQERREAAESRARWAAVATVSAAVLGAAAAGRYLWVARAGGASSAGVGARF